MALAMTPCDAGRAIHVATDGDDANSGSAAAPVATLHRAEQLVAPGDTVMIGPGSYHLGRQGLQVTRSGEPDAPITFRAAVPGKVRLLNVEPVAGFGVYKNTLYCAPLEQKPALAREDGDALHHRWEVKFDGPDDPRIGPGYWTWHDGMFYVRMWEDDDPNDHTITVSYSSIITASGGASYRVWDGLVFDGTYYGLKLAEPDCRFHVVRNCLFVNGCDGIGGGMDALIEHCTFYNQGANTFEHGIYDGLERTVIRFCHFERISGGALHLYKNPKSITVCWNTIGPPKTKRITERGRVGIYLWGRGGHRVFRNLIYGDYRIGAIIAAPDSIIAANTFCQTQVYGLYVLKPARGNLIVNNIVTGRAGRFTRVECSDNVLNGNLYVGSCDWEWRGAEIPRLEALRLKTSPESESGRLAESPFVDMDAFEFALRPGASPVVAQEIGAIPGASGLVGSVQAGFPWSERPGVLFEWTPHVPGGERASPHEGFPPPCVYE